MIANLVRHSRRTLIRPCCARTDRFVVERIESFESRSLSSSADADGDSKANEITTRTNTTKKRNPILAEVIREGFSYLQQSALHIQNAKETRRPLFPKTQRLVTDDHQELIMTLPEPPKPSVLAEQHRLLSAANECLEQIQNQRQQQDSQTPILLIDAHVQKSLRQATIYWTLPLHYWLQAGIEQLESNYTSKTTLRQLEALLQVQQKWQATHMSSHSNNDINSTRHRKPTLARQLQHCVRAKLSSYYAPKIHFEPASLEQVHYHLFAGPNDQRRGEHS